MVTDEERREVAERLRSVAREVDRGGFSETIKHVKLAVFEDLDRYRPNGTLDRLADLIDPDTTKCDRDALLELADEMEGDARYWLSFPYDQLGSHDVLGYACRIREALGVER